MILMKLIMALMTFIEAPLYAILIIGKGLLSLIAITILWRLYKISEGRKNRSPVRADQAVIVTGSTAGIGLAVSKHLFKLGYSVIATYYSEDEIEGLKQLKDLSSQSESRTNKLILVKMDVRRIESIDEAKKIIESWLGANNCSLAAIINNAGIGSLQQFSWSKRTYLKDIIDTNLTGTIMVSRTFMPLLIKSKGRLINVSSGLGYVPGPDYLCYGITKTALIYFTRGLNMELESYGVKCLIIAPANFIKQTDICLGNMERVESSWDEMNEIEKKLFKTEYHKQCEKVKALDSKVKKYHIQQAKKSSFTKSQAANDGILESIKGLVSSVTGTDTMITLEESGILDCFEDALRSNNPPEHIMGGDTFFNSVGGSIFLSLPISCSNFLGKIISPGLYN